MSSSQSTSIEIAIETCRPKEGKTNLHQNVFGCEKNPGHKEFVPINTFTINDLPEDHRDEKLYDYIRMTANLTVRVTVEKISPNRTEEYVHLALTPDTTGYQITGSGWVESVVKAPWRENQNGYNQLCPCKKCEVSTSPSQEWGQVGVHTVRHVVFDDVEAQYATCQLFFDEQDSPLDIIYGFRMSDFGDADERCLLVCASCDKRLLDKLGGMIKEWKSLRHDVIQQYSSDTSRLAVIVSHPHGCTKQVSVGQWTGRQVGSGGDSTLVSTKYTYTVCTCPGSTGAPVFIMGRVSLLLMDHPHCGAHSDGTGFSAYGWDFEKKLGDSQHCACFL